MKKRIVALAVLSLMIILLPACFDPGNDCYALLHEGEVEYLKINGIDVIKFSDGYCITGEYITAMMLPDGSIITSSDIEIATYQCSSNKYYKLYRCKNDYLLLVPGDIKFINVTSKDCR